MSKAASMNEAASLVPSKIAARGTQQFFESHLQAYKTKTSGLNKRSGRNSQFSPTASESATREPIRVFGSAPIDGFRKAPMRI